MQSNLERLSELERRLSVKLPTADIDTEVERRLMRTKQFYDEWT